MTHTSGPSKLKTIKSNAVVAPRVTPTGGHRSPTGGLRWGR